MVGRTSVTRLQRAFGWFALPQYVCAMVLGSILAGPVSSVPMIPSIMKRVTFQKIKKVSTYGSTIPYKCSNQQPPFLSPIASMPTASTTYEVVLWGKYGNDLHNIISFAVQSS